MKLTEVVHEIKFEKEYSNFSEFMEESRDSIYRTFYTGLEKMHLSGSSEVKLLVQATVEGVPFESSFNISTKDTSLLTGLILDYFSDNEEYEICARIISICDEIKML